MAARMKLVCSSHALRYVVAGSSVGLFLGTCKNTSKAPHKIPELRMGMPRPLHCDAINQRGAQIDDKVCKTCNPNSEDNCFIYENDFTNEMIETAAKVDLRSMLCDSCFFTHICGLDDNIIERLAFGLKVFVPKGAMIFEQGQDNTHIFIVGAGQMSVSRNGRKIAFINAGQAVGYREMVMNTKTATAVTVESDNAYLLILDHSHFLGCIDGHPDILNKINLLVEERELQIRSVDDGKMNQRLTVHVSVEEFELLQKYRESRRIESRRIYRDSSNAKWEGA